jgi:hypothetical protein
MLSPRPVALRFLEGRLRRFLEFQWFLHALSDLPGNLLAISAHLLPNLAGIRRTVRVGHRWAATAAATTDSASSGSGNSGCTRMQAAQRALFMRVVQDLLFLLRPGALHN